MCIVKIFISFEKTINNTQMKNLLIIFFASLIFMSCEKKLTPTQILVKDRVEVIGGTKTDLQFKPISEEFVGEVTGTDSLKLLKVAYEDFFNEKLKLEIDPYDFDSLNKFFDNTMELNNEILSKNDELKESVFNLLRVSGKSVSTIRGMEQYKRVLLEYGAKNDNIKNIKIALKKFEDKYVKFETNKDKVYFRLLKSKYSIVNPLMNNAKQEIEAVYILTSDTSAIVGKKDI